MRSLEAARVVFCREHAVYVKRFRYTFELLRTKILKIESRPNETPCRFRDEYRVRSCKGLETCGDIRRLSHRVHRPGTTISNLADNNRTRANTHSTVQGDWP